MIYGFKDLTYSLPNNLVSIENLLKETSLSNEILENMRRGGLRYIPISTVPIETLIQEAYFKLNIVNSNIKGVVYAQSVPFKVNIFPYIPSTTISGQPCAVLHTALKFSLDWSEKVERDILIIGADRIGSIDERLYFNSAMGDVAIVGVIGNKDIIHQILSIHIDSYIFADDGELSKDSNIIQFRKNNPLLIRENIIINLKKIGIKLEDIKFIFPHTPYLGIWDLMSKVLRYPREKIVTKYINKTGHLNSNDSFFHYLRAVEDGFVKKNDIVLLINSGFGGTRGSTIMRYKGKK